MSNEPDEREAAEADANEDLELNDDSADQVRGGRLMAKDPTAAPDTIIQK